MNAKGRQMSMSRLHVVIGAGPLGRAVAEQAVCDGQRVRIVSRTGKANVSGAEDVAADVMVSAAAREACEGAAIVYQCGSPAYHKWVKEYPTFQENVLQGAARAGAVLVAAENLYGYGVAGTLHEGMPLTATTRKGRVRAALSNRLLQAHAAGEVRAVSGRAADFIGPGVLQSSFGEWLWPALIEGKAVGFFGDPDMPHSLTYVPDFARALMQLGANERSWGRAWHVPSPDPLTPRQVIGRIAKLAGIAEPKIKLTPALILKVVGLFIPAAGETVEMGYSYTAPFIMDDAAFRSQIGGASTDWDMALAATLAFWKAR
jgi:nucleoside-diphosphate-sugar epimerase